MDSQKMQSIRHPFLWLLHSRGTCALLPQLPSYATPKFDVGFQTIKYLSNNFAKNNGKKGKVSSLSY
jgi:hypothetical protein